MSEVSRVVWVEGRPSSGGRTRGSDDGRDSLEGGGFAVETCDTTTLGERIDERRSDCVVCDGDNTADPVAVVERVRDRDPVLPVVVVAADGDEGLAHRTVAAGAAEYVPERSGDAVVSAVERAVEHGERARAGRRARTHHRVLFEEAPDPMIEYEFVDGEPVVRSVNRSFVETFGFDRASAVGEPMNDLVVPEEKQAEAESLDERAQSGKRVDAEVERETADGVREFLFRNIAVESDGGPVGYAVYIDVTDQRERERRLQEQNDRLNEFASVVGHDLRNPMGAVKHRIEMARRTGDDRHLDDALSALDRMDELLRDLLQMARQGEELGKTEPVSLVEVARTAWGHIATREASLVVGDGRTVLADRGRLTQLLENLFINAVEHGSDADEGRSVTVRVGVDGDCVFVEDDGPGIPASNRQDVFDSGFSTASEGTGYGLAIVRQVARAHDWEVGVTDGSDGGARFEFRGVEFVDS
ncbi:receiver/sensor box histidine kinase [Halosimplex salinum]|uniref:receiver/sensor box histidine kinase n=1 Tax=Halosimplex salinum TaxID=1710538 RepID=UPI000F48BA04|nr:PAS domain-containing sensor histidine kinase [Halosimplex salinum]